MTSRSSAAARGGSVAPADMLPFTRGLMDTLSAPKASVSVAQLAPPREVPESVLAPLTHATEVDMVGTMQDLRIDTVEKNAELTRVLDDVAQRTARARARLDDEVIPQRAAAFAAQKASVTAALEALEVEFSARIASTFSAHDASLRDPSVRLDNAVAAEAECYGHEVPDLFDATCGPSVQRMRADEEALQLDTATVRGGEWRGRGLRHAMGLQSLASFPAHP